MSVGRLCDKGSAVHFCASGGEIRHPSGKTIHFKRENGVYVLEAELMGADAEGRSSGFTRPET